MTILTRSRRMTRIVKHAKHITINVVPREDISRVSLVFSSDSVEEYASAPQGTRRRHHARVKSMCRNSRLHKNYRYIDEYIIYYYDLFIFLCLLLHETCLREFTSELLEDIEDIFPRY